MDPKLQQLINKEEKQQKQTINMIASESYISQEVKQCLASSISNKYIEGLPENRQYPGLQNINEIENITCDYVRKIFQVPQNYDIFVQAHSGAPANLELFSAILPLNSTILMNSHANGEAGHMSFGDKGSLINKIFNVCQYHLREDGIFDLNLLEQSIQEYKPKMVIVGFSAYPLDLEYEKLYQLKLKYNFHLHLDCSHIAGMIAAKIMKNPFPYVDSVTFTTHKGLGGPKGAVIICRLDKLYQTQKYDNITDINALSQKEQQNLYQINRQLIYSGIFFGVQAGAHGNNMAGICQALYQAQQPQFIKQQQRCNHFAKLSIKLLNQYNIKSMCNNTDSHMVIAVCNNIDASQAEDLLAKIGIFVNGTESKISKQSIRLGFNCLSLMNTDDKDIEFVINIIQQVMNNQVKEEQIDNLRQQVQHFCEEKGFK